MKREELKERREFLKLAGLAFTGLAMPNLALPFKIQPAAPIPAVLDPFMAALIKNLQTGPLSKVTQVTLQALPPLSSGFYHNQLEQRTYQLHRGGLAVEVLPDASTLPEYSELWAALQAGDGETFLRSQSKYLTQRAGEYIDTKLLRTCDQLAKPARTVMKGDLAVLTTHQFADSLLVEGTKHSTGVACKYKAGELVVSDRRANDARPLVLRPRAFTIALDPTAGYSWEVDRSILPPFSHLFCMSLVFGTSVCGHDPVANKFYDFSKVGELRS